MGMAGAHSTAPGRWGELFADILTDFPEKFSDRKKLWLIPDPELPRARQLTAPREVELTRTLAAQGRHCTALLQSDSISAAPRHCSRATIVAIPEAERAALAEDEVYIGDLIGCRLVDVAGEEPVEVGRIENVNRTAGAGVWLCWLW